MGVCSSCLGLNRYRDTSDDEENSRLLFDDVHPNQYGSFGDQNVGIIQADPQEAQRETEALQKVVTNISNHLVDIFAMVPQKVQPTPNSTFPGQDARLLRYQDVLTKISASRQSNGKTHLSVDNTPYISDGWISEDDTEEEPPAKRADVGPLLGGFADAENIE